MRLPSLDFSLPNFADGERWFVFSTLPRQEKRAQIQLENQLSNISAQAREDRAARPQANDRGGAPFFPRYIIVLARGHGELPNHAPRPPHDSGRLWLPGRLTPVAED
jgi:hypothetical protein